MGREWHLSAPSENSVTAMWLPAEIISKLVGRQSLIVNNDPFVGHRAKPSIGNAHSQCSFRESRSVWSQCFCLSALGAVRCWHSSHLWWYLTVQRETVARNDRLGSMGAGGSHLGDLPLWLGSVETPRSRFVPVKHHLLLCHSAKQPPEEPPLPGR